MIFALESYKWSHTYIDSQLVRVNTADWQWWTVSHFDRSCCDLLPARRQARRRRHDILAGQEVIVPCMVGDNKENLQTRPRCSGCKASLKLIDYNAKRDYVGWGGDDFDRLAGMAGFSNLPRSAASTPRRRRSPSSISTATASPTCAWPAPAMSLLQNGGDAHRSDLPGMKGGCRAAVWADYNGDGKPDLLLATPTGPKLFTNLGAAVPRRQPLLPAGAGLQPHRRRLDRPRRRRPARSPAGQRLSRPAADRKNSARVDEPGQPNSPGWRSSARSTTPSKGLRTAYPPEKEIDLAKKYKGKNNLDVAWPTSPTARSSRAASAGLVLERAGSSVPAVRSADCLSNSIASA